MMTLKEYNIMAKIPFKIGDKIKPLPIAAKRYYVTRGNWRGVIVETNPTFFNAKTTSEEDKGTYFSLSYEHFTKDTK